ncbi:hypothetical protein, partial [Paenibacillus amylolyticus]|uniref:hypothetical protein n=1 Tax=Paenibacillus amylolyticus TaxID=1451 RepID=UPI00339A13FE
NIFDIIVAIVKNIVPRINGDPFITFLRYALLLHIMDNSFSLEPKQIKKANEKSLTLTRCFFLFEIL